MDLVLLSNLESQDLNTNFRTFAQQLKIKLAKKEEEKPAETPKAPEPSNEEKLLMEDLRVVSETVSVADSENPPRLLRTQVPVRERNRRAVCGKSTSTVL